MTSEERFALVVKEIDEVIRLVPFGHGGMCSTVVHGKADDEYDTNCNLCKALDALRIRRREAKE